MENPVRVLQTSPVATRQVSRRSLVAMFGRHQIASLLSTVVDFGSMIAAVEVLRLTPVVGTIVGAALGAITNFTLGRFFTFRARTEHPAPQAARYALVSGASGGLNALGEHVLHGLLGVQYMAARAIVAIVVSLFWNFPLQRWFVFRDRAAASRETPLHDASEADHSASPRLERSTAA